MLLKNRLKSIQLDFIDCSFIRRNLYFTAFCDKNYNLKVYTTNEKNLYLDDLFQLTENVTNLEAVYSKIRIQNGNYTSFKSNFKKNYKFSYLTCKLLDFYRMCDYLFNATMKIGYVKKIFVNRVTFPYDLEISLFGIMFSRGKNISITKRSLKRTKSFFKLHIAKNAISLKSFDILLIIINDNILHYHGGSNVIFLKKDKDS